MEFPNRKFICRGGTHYLVDTTDIDFARRVVFVFDEISCETANRVIAALHCLAYDSLETITLYFFSPGGDVAAGFSIYDTCRAIGCPIRTVACGLTASMAAFLVSCAGTKGERYIQPNAELLIHQPLGGYRGQASDIRIHAEHVLKTRTKLNRIWSEVTGQPLEKIESDTDRDCILTAEEAVAYGLVDKIGDPVNEWKEVAV